MKEKLKLYGPIIGIALIFYMMISTPHSRALGDIILESIGIAAWTNGYNGIHLTVIYFGILFLVVLMLISRFPKEERRRYRKHNFLVFIFSVTIIFLIHSSIVHNIMKNSEGLYSIAITSTESRYKYNIKNGELEEFSYEFELTNYADEIKEFSLDVEFGDDNIYEFEIYDKQGELAKFNINGKESRRYIINLDDYMIKVSGADNQHHIGSSGIIDSIILLDSEGNRVKVVKLNGIVIEM